MALYITPAERSALQLLASGRTRDEIAGRLGTSDGDLETQLLVLFRKLGVTTRHEAVTAALRRGLLHGIS
jgi:DNA-binding CsgD family transcriptional regulator